MKKTKLDVVGFFLDHLSLASKAFGRVISIRYVALILILITAALLYTVNASAIPSSPQITYVSNSTFVSSPINRSVDQKGTITVLSLALNQQDYRWKAYVGNVSGTLALDDANSKSIYDWSLSSVTGEVYVSRAASVSWVNVSCVDQTAINNEQTALGISSSAQDSINSTFNYNAHKTFLIGTKTITNSTCRSTATYINDAAQTINENALFQEVLLRDAVSGNMIYATILEQDETGYDGSNTYDFQLIVAENESSNIPTPYFFYVELG